MSETPQQPEGQQPEGQQPEGQQPEGQQPPVGEPAPPPPPPPAEPPAYQQPSQQGQQQPAYQQAPPAGVLSPSEERTWAGAAHWSIYVASLVGLSFLGPLLVMLIQGNKSPYVRAHAVESLNFQLSLLIYAIVSAVLLLILVGIFLLIAVGLMWLIFPILATIKASAGEPYRYPLTIRMVS